MLDPSQDVVDPNEMTNLPNFIVERLCMDSPANLLNAARDLLLEYGSFIAAQAGVAGFCLGDLEREAANLPGIYLNRDGGVLLVRKPDNRSHWLGSIAWRSLPLPQLARAREIKRLWVRPEARGLGLGRRLVQAVIDQACADGKTELLLDTAPGAMKDAFQLYRAMGFEECAAYNGRTVDGIVYMRKSL